MKPFPPTYTKVGTFPQYNETVSADIYTGRRRTMKPFPPTSKKVGKFPQNNETVSADIYKGRKVPAE